jgi:CheY-like chemotaxis protein
MMMPVLDGPATVTALHALEPTLPVVTASGLASPRRLARAAGHHAFLPKPYTAEQLTYINPILKQYALDVNDLEMAKIFNHQSQIMDAIRALHDFSFQFQNEEDVYDEFKSELDYLYDSINGLKEIGRASV